MVPYLDLRAQIEPIRGEIAAAIDRVLDDAAFVSGPAVSEFEQAFASYVGAAHCVAVGSGTDALHVTLRALGVGIGDEVITQANTFIATIEAVEYTGARCVLVDVMPPAYTMDVDAVSDAITPRTRVVIPVHLYGQPAPLDPLHRLCGAHGITLLEDASQAHGAAYRGKRVGSHGLASWSFYPGKNLGAFGEAGAVTCMDGDLAQRMRMLIDHGSVRRYAHAAVGYNYRMDGIQGAVLGVKLRHLDAWNEGRRRIAARYGHLLGDVERPTVPSDVLHSWHVYPVLVAQRDRVRERMEGAGIGTNVHYPIPVHLQEGYRYLGYKRGAFPQAEDLAYRELSLPIYAELTGEQVEAVARSLRASVRDAA